MISTQQIQAALDQKEFYLVYLPIISLVDGKCVGAETLVRWNHAGLEIPPDDFIPQCEDNPLIGLLTFWIIEQISQELGAWLRQTTGTHISLNMSPGMLGRGGAFYAAQNAGLGDIFDRFIVEITERGLTDQQAIDSIKNFKPDGVKVALDDFGTGDANLLELSKIPADILKLDKFFVDQITESTACPRIINGLVGFAHGMGLTMIAEGVESEHQATVLRDLGVEMAQGWYFSKPLRAVDLIDFCEDNTRA